MKNTKGKVIGSLDEDCNGGATVCCRSMLPPFTSIDRFLGVASYDGGEVGLAPGGLPRFMSTPGFDGVASTVGAGQNREVMVVEEEGIVEVCGALSQPSTEGEEERSLAEMARDPPNLEKTSLPIGCDKKLRTGNEEVVTRWEPMLQPTKVAVVVQSPAGKAESRDLASGGEFPTIVVALPAAQVGVQIHLGGGETSTDSDDMLGLVKAKEISVNTSGTVTKICSSDDDDVTGGGIYPVV